MGKTYSECGCGIRLRGNSSDIEIDFCPLHKAAEAMRDLILRAYHHANAPTLAELESVLKKAGAL